MAGILYFPLNRHSGHIRLVSLHPGTFDDDIICDLLHAPLEHFKRYEALSYAWGDGESTSSIMLKGRRFPVRKNLDVALRHLRYEPVPGRVNTRLLWIDAICINQADIQERNLQVLRMPDIYQAAENVVAWLGEGTMESDLGIDFMNRFAEVASGNTDSLTRHRAYRDEYLGVVSILTRPWWQRMWVVQEVALARDLTIVCGTRSTSWRTMLLFSSIVHQYHKAAVAEVLRRFDRDVVRNSIMAAIMSQIRNEWQAGQIIPLCRLITRFRSFQSTLPVDKIYGLLGMAAEVDNAALHPDYAKSVEQVYKEITKFIIEEEKSLNFICVSFGPKKLRGLPSWTPDFTVPNIDITNPLKGLDGLFEKGLYSSAGTTSMSVAFSPSLDSMHVRGIYVDDISIIADYWSPDLSYTDFWDGFPPKLQEWSDLVMSAADSVTSRYGADKLRLAICKTLTADRTMDSKWRVSRLPPDQCFNDLLLDSGTTYDVPGAPNEKKIRYEDDVTELIEGALTHRRFMVSKNGYIGLVPEYAEPQDQICVLFGCDTPVVLRKQGDSTVFVGECYIHGIMDGEAVQGQIFTPSSLRRGQPSEVTDFNQLLVACTHVERCHKYSSTGPTWGCISDPMLCPCILMAVDSEYTGHEIVAVAEHVASVNWNHRAIVKRRQLGVYQMGYEADE